MYSHQIPGTTVTKKTGHMDKIKYKLKKSISGKGLLKNEIYSNPEISPLFLREYFQKIHPPEPHQNCHIQDAIFDLQ